MGYVIASYSCLYLMKQYDDARKYFDISLKADIFNMIMVHGYFYYGLFEYTMRNIQTSNKFCNESVKELNHIHRI